MKFSCLFLISFILYSCTQVNKANSKKGSIYYQSGNSLNFHDSLGLSKSDSFYFEIDKTTPLTSSSIDFFVDKNGQEYYTSLNVYTNSIDIYDFETKKVLKKIKLFKNGPNGVGPTEYIAHKIINLDSILLVNSWTSEVFVVNNSGRVLIKISVPMPSKGKYIPAMDANTNKPILFGGKSFFITGGLLDFDITDQTKVMSVVKIDLTTKIPTFIFPQSELFNYGTWGGMQYHLFGTFNKNTNKLVYSYAGDPFIYVSDLNGQIESKHFLGSKYFEAITPLTDERLTSKNVDLSQLEKYDFVSPRYDKIIYDPYRNLYYRFALLALTEEEYKNPKKRELRKTSIIICNNTFEKIGEITFPKDCDQNMFFINKEGIHFAQLANLQENQNKLMFKTFTVKKQ